MTKRSGHRFASAVAMACLGLALCGCPQEAPAPPPPAPPPPPPPPKFQTPLPAISADWPPQHDVSSSAAADAPSVTRLPRPRSVSWDGVAPVDAPAEIPAWTSLASAEPRVIERYNSRTYETGIPFEKIRQLVISSGPSPKAVVLSFNHDSARGSQSPLGTPAQIDVIDLNTSEHLGQRGLPDFGAVLDVSLDGQWVAVRHSHGEPTTAPTRVQTRLDLYPLNGEQSPIGWIPLPGEPGESGSVIVAAGFVDDAHLLVLGEQGDAVLWQFPELRPIYHLRTGATQPRLVFSADRASFGVPTYHHWHFFDAKTGQRQGALEFPVSTETVVQAAAVSPQGDELVALLSTPADRLVHWDLATGEVTDTYPIPAMYSGQERSPANAGVQWVAENLLLCNGWLIDQRRKSAVWQLPYAGETMACYRGPDYRHWGVVPAPQGSSGNVVAWQIPDRSVSEMLDSTPPLPAPEYGSDTHVSLKFELEGEVTGQDDFEKQMRRIVARKLEQVGWLLDDRAPIEFVVKIKTAGNQRTEVNASRSEIISSTEASGMTISTSPPVEPSRPTLNLPHATYGFEIRTGQEQPAHVYEAVVVGSAPDTSTDTLWSEIKRRFAQEILFPAMVYPRAPETLLPSTALYPDPTEAVRRAVAEEKQTQMEALSHVGSIAGSAFREPHDEGVISVGTLGGMRDYLVTIGRDKLLKLWNPTDLKVVQSTMEKGGIERMSVYGDGRRLVFSTSEGRLRVYDASRRSVASTKDFNGEQFTALNTNGESAWVVGGTASGKVVTWMPGDTIGGEFAIFTSPVVGVAVLSRTNRYVAADEAGNVKVGDLTTGEVTDEFAAYGQVTSMHATIDQTLIAMGTARHGLQLIDAQSFDLIREIDHGRVAEFKFAPNGEQVFVGGADGRLNLWNVDGSPVRRLSGLSGAVTGIAVSADGLNVAASSAGSLSLVTWGLGATSRRTPSNGNGQLIRSTN